MVCFFQQLVLTAKYFKWQNEQTRFISDNDTPQKFAFEIFHFFFENSPSLSANYLPSL